jgi:hypothetical protein
VTKKLFWAWVAVEVVGAAWFGWQVARAQAKPWARQRPKGLRGGL